ncbi:hypothetical protein DFH94DRAFT_683153 [Russula ochroleuca]|jgi:hypothetical protein|uniref:Uncharacterized protein n=1 Tax=Russula ochroleuca TaxID=152965 RepID=A0A9P5MSX9_9AGAM|nr:hypothetical protein DFH94DRAFT_683153 [Russula ochroleuca]
MSEAPSNSASHGELTKLTDSGINNNYAEWAMKSHHQLRSWGLWKHIEGLDSDPPPIPVLKKPVECTGPNKQGIEVTIAYQGNEEEHKKKMEEAKPWVEANQLALSKIVSVTPNSQLHLVDVQYAK